MKTKVLEKEKAIELRKMGNSYKDILSQVFVSKSTISSWLKDLSITSEEKKLLKERIDTNISRGRIKSATAIRRNRLDREKKLFIQAKSEFEVFKNDPMFFVGVGLYWAEGSKRSSTFHFMNSDPEMVVFMISWCRKFLLKEVNNISLRLYTHRLFESENLEEYWSKTTGISLSKFKKTVYKPSGLGYKKRPMYKGCMRIEISKGMHLLRKMQFWQQLLVGEFRKNNVL
ncbi:MAG TPA: hypothetical protein VJC13_00010 [Candidatus Paceibacterota bacterium]|nr:hypothetical protein [uncultured archaeon]